jgi:hypothetical protein
MLLLIQVAVVAEDTQQVAVEVESVALELLLLVIQLQLLQQLLPQYVLAVNQLLM